MFGKKPKGFAGQIVKGFVPNLWAIFFVLIVIDIGRFLGKCITQTIIGKLILEIFL